VEGEPTLAILVSVSKAALPVRSAVLKPCAGCLVVGWVTTSESLLLIIFAFWTLISGLREVEYFERFVMVTGAKRPLVPRG
jgi:hypothetical protein